MSGDQLEEAEVDRLGAAVFEQRRLSHMLRQRGAEIEALRGDRERLEADLGKARYEARRADRRVAELEEAHGRHRDELKEAGQQREQIEAEKQRELMVARQQRDAARSEVTVVEAERGRLQRELEHARYEARRADRRVVKAEAAAHEARKRARLQLDALAAELREGLAVRDLALEARKEMLERYDEAVEECDRVRVAAAGPAKAVEECALQLGQAQRDVEYLTGLERQREVLILDSERTLGEVGECLQRVSRSRSWRWGHGFAQALRALTFRRRSNRSALDIALSRLERKEGPAGAG